VTLSSSIYGQLYVFRVEQGGDYRFSGYRRVRTTKALNTVRKLLSARGGLEFEKDVLRINGVRSRYQKLELHTPLRIPDKLRGEAFFAVLAGDGGPQIISGYARIEQIPRSERAALSVFTGYDPIVMELPVRFEAEPGHNGVDIENDIAELEKMCGRGNFTGAAQGAPPRISVSTVTTDKTIINLIPAAYQWSENNKSAPVWWISGLQWGGDVWRDDDGNRIRQTATVTLTQYVRPDLLGNTGATERNKANGPLPAGQAQHDPNRPNVATGVGSA
jgi:hypothetical protein